MAPKAPSSIGRKIAEVVRCACETGVFSDCGVQVDLVRAPSASVP